MSLSRKTITLIITGLIVAGGIGIYTATHKPAAPYADRSIIVDDINAFLQQDPATPKLDGVDIMIASLAARLEREPTDMKGWRMLGWSYFSQEQHKEAAAAYAKAVALAPENASYRSAYGEAVVMAAGGYVSDEALGIFDKTLTLDPTDSKARFFKGLALDQAGDPAAAISAWIKMIDTAPANADWVPDLRDRITERAAQVGIDIEGRMNTAPQK